MVVLLTCTFSPTRLTMYSLVSLISAVVMVVAEHAHIVELWSDERGRDRKHGRAHVVQRPLSDLEVLAADAAGKLAEERLLDLLKFGRLDDVEDLLDLIEIHDLFGRVYLRPVLEQAKHNVLRKRGVFLEELDDAVGQLRVVKSEAFDLVQRDEDAVEEGLVLLLER
jgi:hypothetical protein